MEFAKKKEEKEKEKKEERKEKKAKEKTMSHYITFPLSLLHHHC